MSTTHARTTHIGASDASLQQALRLGLLFALVKFCLHLATNLWQAHIGYGYFRDEFYYLMCGRHLDWGYVDHGPIVALQARLAETLFGHSLAGIRILSAVAGAARVLLTGLLAWSLGGRRPAQGLAMLAILLVPQYLGLDSYLSMNSFESIFWMTCLLCFILILRGYPEPRLWVFFGLSAGIGLLNKPSMTFFLLALLAGLLLTPQRNLLRNRYAALGVALLLLIALPNLLWQIHYHWPTFEFLEDGRIENKNTRLGPVAFLLRQILNLHPVTLVLWVPGLVWLLRHRPWRWLGYTFLLFLAGMMALHAKDYYVVPIYPVLFAAGGIAWESRFHARTWVLQNRVFAFPIYAATLIFFGLVALPLAIPVLTPDQWIAYTRATHLADTNSNTENTASGPLPQFYADRFGWQEEVDEVTRIYRSLPAEDRARVGILASNYGEAGALEFLGHDLPPVVSGHNNYWLWGPHNLTGEVMIVINGAPPEEMRKYYDSVQIAGHMDHPLSMPYERRNIYLVRGRKRNLTADWKELKHYI